MHNDSHSWDVSPAQAIQIQESLRSKVVEEPLDFTRLHYVAGVDVGFPGHRARAAVVVLKFPSLEVTEQTIIELPVSFPYIPGLLSFREAPPILAALERLETRPDVLICDGHGLAHPRRFGLACHLGVLLDQPVTGCAKSILVGKHGPLGDAYGSTANLMIGNESIGAAVRTRQGVKPVYVSIGNRIDLPSAIQLVLACSRGYRLPEPTRLADRLTKIS